MTQVATKRTELLSVVDKEDVDGLLQIIEKLGHDNSLVDTLAEFSKRQMNELWDGILRVCMSTLLAGDEQPETNLEQMCGILQCIISAGRATLASVQQLKDAAEPATAQTLIPQSLHETAIILHGTLPTMAEEMSSLKNQMSKLFEEWWIQGIPGCKELMGNTVVYLLAKSTAPKSLKSDITRVWKIHGVLSAINLNSESASVLVPYLLQCVHHPQFLSTTEGIKFLSFLFTLNPELIEQLHQSVKNHLYASPRSRLIKYGEIYFNAWKRASEEIREKLENFCIQDLMYRAIQAQRGGRQSMSSVLFGVVTYFHKQKTQRGIEAMLARLYQPILWRSMSVANSDVRMNAATLFFDVFPLQDTSLQLEQADGVMQKQFDLIHTLLSDPVPSVRVLAVHGVGEVLCLYWELIPVEVIQCFISKLVQDLVYDISSPAVRLEVIKVMHRLCDNHLCIPILKKVLPELRNFVHDPSENVRVAMFDLLLNVKGLRAIKFWNVVPVEHILARLAVDPVTIVRRIMKLLRPSFVPLNQSPLEQARRCITLIKGNRQAARQFFLNLPQYLNLQDTVDYMVMLCRFVLENSRRQNALLRSDEENSCEERDSNDSRNSGDSRPKKKRGEQDSCDQELHEENDNQTAGRDKDEEDPEEQLDAVVFAGMVEGIYLMYTAVASQLRSETNSKLQEGLLKKLGIMIRELLATSRSPELDTALIALAGDLPNRALPLMRQNLLNRLKHNSLETMDAVSIITSLVKWGESEEIIGMVINSVEKAWASVDSVTPGNEVAAKKKTVAFAEEETGLTLSTAMDLTLKMISQAECRSILLKKHKTRLMSLVNCLQRVLSFLRNGQANKIDTQSSCHSELWSQSKAMFALYLRLLVFLGTACKDTDESNRKHILNILVWTQDVVLQKLALTSAQQTEEENVVWQELAVAVAKTCKAVLMIGMQDQEVLNHIGELNLGFLHLKPRLPLTMEVLSCVYQMTQLRPETVGPTSAVPESIGHEQLPPVELNIHVKMACSCLIQSLESVSNFLINSENKCNKSEKSETFQVAMSLCPIVAKIVHGLLQNKRSPPDLDCGVSAIVSIILKETEKAGIEEELPEDGGLPQVSSALLNVLLKNPKTRRLLVGEVNKILDKPEVPSIHCLQSIVLAVAAVKSKFKDGVDASLIRSLYQALSAVTPDQMDEDIFRNLKEKIQDLLHSLSRDGDTNDMVSI